MAEVGKMLLVKTVGMAMRENEKVQNCRGKQKGVLVEIIKMILWTSKSEIGK